MIMDGKHLFRKHSDELTVSEQAREAKNYIHSKYPNKRIKVFRIIDRMSLLQYHMPPVTSENHPLDVIWVDFLSNIRHLYTAGANVNSGVPNQSFMLMRTVLETLTKDMRLLSLYYEDDPDYKSMYEWITQRDGPGYDPELSTWGWSANRKYLFSGEVYIKVRDFYGKLSKLVHGSSRLVLNNIYPSDEMIADAWEHIYFLALNALLVMMYSFKEFLPINEEHQDDIRRVIDDFGYPDDFLISENLAEMQFSWLEENL